MIFPIRTDRQLRQTPWVNISLIVINTFVFVLTLQGVIDRDRFMLDPVWPRLVQYISYQFMHGGWMHLIGNMLFLYVFGNSVEDRLGKVGYLSFYLSGGVLAGLGHSLVNYESVLGASGSCAAVTGAYLALFPLSNVTLVYWFYIIGTFELPSMLLILFKVGQDLVFQLGGMGGVAYLAHLSGYACGFGVGMGLLWARLLPREPYDLLTLIEQRRRRAQFKALTRRGYKPWEGAGAGVPAKDGKAPQASAEQEQIMQLREQVIDGLKRRDLDSAVDRYAALLQSDPNQVMSQQHQLDLANHLMVTERYDLAAGAYELFLNIYGGYAQHEQVELILALIYVRYLDRGQRARELLNQALPRLHDPEQKTLAQQILDELG